MNIKAIIHNKRLIGGVAVVGAVAVVFASGWLISDQQHANNAQNRPSTSQATGPVNGTDHINTVPTQREEAIATTDPIMATLNHMIEEEKLAHDVYQVLADKWGARVFSNITRSETNHQNELLAIIESNGVTDPRTGKVGTFNDKDLQALYDKLIAQGSASASEAYKVGVAIETLDIDDLKKAMAGLTDKDTDLKAAYTNLMNGSERHLAAFNRQLNR